MLECCYVWPLFWPKSGWALSIVHHVHLLWFAVLGNPRGNENPFLLTMGILWFREHNSWARRLKQSYPGWSDEQLYQRARQFTIAEYQVGSLI